MWQSQPDHQCASPFSFSSFLSYHSCPFGADIPPIHSFHTTLTHLGVTVGGWSPAHYRVKIMTQTTINANLKSVEGSQQEEENMQTTHSLPWDSNSRTFLQWGNSADYCTTTPPWDWYQLHQLFCSVSPSLSLCICTRVRCLSPHVTWISLAMGDRSIYYPVYVKPSRVSWHGIFFILKHQWPSLTFFRRFSCPFSIPVAFVLWSLGDSEQRCGKYTSKCSPHLNWINNICSQE